MWSGEHYFVSTVHTNNVFIQPTLIYLWGEICEFSMGKAGESIANSQLRRIWWQIRLVLQKLDLLASKQVLKMTISTQFSFATESTVFRLSDKSNACWDWPKVFCSWAKLKGAVTYNSFIGLEEGGVWPFHFPWNVENSDALLSEYLQTKHKKYNKFRLCSSYNALLTVPIWEMKSTNTVQERYSGKTRKRKCCWRAMTVLISVIWLQCATLNGELLVNH